MLYKGTGNKPERLFITLVDAVVKPKIRRGRNLGRKAAFLSF
jgi:hypothetical protein